MLCRALLVAIAISYLICVLFLSGIQKEDLDVSLLKKLQRYNVNLDDFTDKQLREECLTSLDNNRSIEEIKEVNEGENDFNTTNNEVITTTQRDTTTNYFGTLNTTELETVLKFLKDKKSIRETTTTESSALYDANVEKDVKSNKEMKEYILTRMLTKMNANLKKKGVSEIQRNKSASSLDGVVKFWETYLKLLPTNVSLDKDTKENMTFVENLESKDISQPQNKTIEMNNSKEVARITKVLAEYLNKQHLLSTQAQSETERTTIRTDSPQVENLLTRSHEIEQQFASSIAAINKLNENIATLQNNFKSVKYLSTNTPRHNKENMTIEDNSNIYTSGGFSKTSTKNMVETSKFIQQKEILNQNPQDLLIYDQVKQNERDSQKLTIENNNYNLKNELTYSPNTRPVLDITSTRKHASSGNVNNDALNIDELRNTTKFQKPENTKSYNYDNQREDNIDKLKIQNSSANVENRSPQYTSPIQNSQDIRNYGYYEQKEPNDLTIQPKNVVDLSNNRQYPNPKPQYAADYGYDNQMGSIYINQNVNKEKVQENYKRIDAQYGTIYAQQAQDVRGYPYNRYPPYLGTNIQNETDLQNYLPQKQDVNLYDKDERSDDSIKNVQFIANATKSTYTKYIPENLNLQDPTIYTDNKQGKPDTYLPDQYVQHLKQKLINIDELDNSRDNNKEGKPLSTGIYRQVTDLQTPTNYGYDKPQDLNPDVPVPFVERLSKKLLHINKLDDSTENKNEVKAISADVLKQIAESVKEIVLKDLRQNVTTASTAAVSITSTAKSTTKELAKTESIKITKLTATTMKTRLTTITTQKPTKTIKTTTTTTPLPTTKSPSSPTIVLSSTVANTTDIASLPKKIDFNKVEVATLALERFLELFEQLKTVRGNSIPSKTEPKRVPTNVVLKPKLETPLLYLPPPLMPAMNPYGVKVDQKYMPLVVNPYAGPRLPNAPLPPTLTDQRPVINMLSPAEQASKSNIKHFQGEPQMIQTNANQIHPLGVQMIQPERLNMNIVLTTQHPYWSKMERDRWNFMTKYGRNPDKRNDIAYIKESMNAYSHNNYKPRNSDVNPNVGQVSKPNYCDHTHDKQTRLNLISEIKVYNKRHNEHIECKDKKVDNANDRNQRHVETSVYDNQHSRLNDNKDDVDYNIDHNKNPEKYTDTELDPVFHYQDNHNNYNNYSSYDENENAERDYSFIDKSIRQKNRNRAPDVNPDVNYKYPEHQYKSDTSRNQVYDVNHMPLPLLNNRYLQPDVSISSHGDTIYPRTSNRQQNYDNSYYKDYSHVNSFNSMPKHTNQNLNSPNMKPIMNRPVRDRKPRIINKYRDYRNLYSALVLPDKNENKEYHPELDNTYKYIEKPNYAMEPHSRFKHFENDYSIVYPSDPMKTKVNNPESYLDNPNQMEHFHADTKNREIPLDNFKEREYTNFKFKSVERDYGFPKPKDNTKLKFDVRGKYFSHPSTDDFNQLKRIKNPLIRPYTRFDKNIMHPNINKDIDTHNHNDVVAAWIDKNKETGNNDHNLDHMEIITAMIRGNHDKSRTSSDDEKNNHDSQQYRPQQDSAYLDGKSLGTQMESSETRQYHNPAGDEIEGKQYPAGVKGFHEKLENSDGWPENPRDCGTDEHCTMKFVSRQQIPLNGVKPSKFDDTHFKNFLKTQQKVNQMLERILATKDIQDTHGVQVL